MKRIDTATRETDKFGTGKDGFTDGDPGVTSPTVADASIMDSLQEALARVVEVAGAGAALVEAVYQQVAGVVLRRLWLHPFTEQTPAGAYGGSWYGAAHGEAIGIDLYVLVGDSAQIQTSPLGETWTARTAGSSYASNWGDVIASAIASEFVACGAVGEVQTSSDGITWTRRNNAGNGLNALTESGSVLVAVGASGRIMSSTDAHTWTDRTADASYTGTFIGVVWNGSVFVAIGSDGEVQTSPDGTTWTEETAITGADADHVGVNADTGRVIVTRQADLTIFYSDDDGATFTSDASAVYDAGGSDACEEIRCFDGLWILHTTNDYMQTSVDDGASWFLHRAAGFAGTPGPFVLGTGPTRRVLCGSASANGEIFTSERG